MSFLQCPRTSVPHLENFFPNAGVVVADLTLSPVKSVTLAPNEPTYDEWVQQLKRMSLASTAGTRTDSKAVAESSSQAATGAPKIQAFKMQAPKIQASKTQAPKIQAPKIQVTRDVVAIFGSRWVAAAQRAGRGLDMGGFPSGPYGAEDAAISGTQTIASNSGHGNTNIPTSSTDIIRQTPTPPTTSNYQGDTSLPENLSAPIPGNKSTSLYIRGLGPSVTFSDILAVIRNTGRVYSIFVNPPSEDHWGSAAKLSFFTRAAAETFYNATRNGFWVKGHCAEVLWNRVLVAEHVQRNWQTASRVVIIRGRKSIVNLTTVLGIIDNNIRMYELEHVTEKDYEQIQGWLEIELHFGSFRAQGHSAFIVLKRVLGRKGVRVTHGVDPCE